MNRPLHFNYIVSKLSSLATEIELRGKLNLLDLHPHADNFYQHLFNELFGRELENLDAIKPNAAAIDLIDRLFRFQPQRKMRVQVQRFQYQAQCREEAGGFPVSISPAYISC